jgi:hypothetical protein
MPGLPWHLARHCTLALPALGRKTSPHHVMSFHVIVPIEGQARNWEVMPFW